jgi:hypothetical protein
MLCLRIGDGGTGVLVPWTAAGTRSPTQQATHESKRAAPAGASSGLVASTPPALPSCVGHGCDQERTFAGRGSGETVYPRSARRQCRLGEEGAAGAAGGADTGAGADAAAMLSCCAAADAACGRGALLPVGEKPLGGRATAAARFDATIICTRDDERRRSRKKHGTSTGA